MLSNYNSHTNSIVAAAEANLPHHATISITFASFSILYIYLLNLPTETHSYTTSVLQGNPFFSSLTRAHRGRFITTMRINIFLHHVKYIYFQYHFCCNSKTCTTLFAIMHLFAILHLALNANTKYDIQCSQKND